MSSLLRSLLVCLVTLAFAIGQAGIARAAADDCCPEDEAAEASDEGPACAGPEDGGSCVPECDDCLRCASTSRVMLAAVVMPQPVPPLATTFEHGTASPAVGRDATVRLERPPRA